MSLLHNRVHIFEILISPFPEKYPKSFSLIKIKNSLKGLTIPNLINRTFQNFTNGADLYKKKDQNLCTKECHPYMVYFDSNSSNNETFVNRGV